MNENDHAPLLMQKVRPPRLWKGLVRRRRLEKCIGELENNLLIVVNAPSGFGKTTLGAAWAKELNEKSAIVSWLALDQEDDEPTHFLRYLGYSITSAGNEDTDEKHAGRALPFSPQKSKEYISHLINYITEVGDEFYIFLDDFHLITDAAISAHICFLLQNAPSNLHLVLLSRTKETKISLSKNLTPMEINTGDLRFTVDETAELFENYPTRIDRIARAHSATGGWVAALRILAASDADILDSPSIGKGTLESQQSFARLLDTVLSGMTPEELRFIEMTAVVVRMCPALFNELTGATNGRQIIERADYANALISRVADDDYWVECHDLVREAMLTRLLEKEPAFIGDIAHRASQWYAKQEYWNEAVTQALIVGNQKLAVKWIEACAEKLMKTGDLLALLGWDRTLKLSSNKETPDSILFALAFAKTLGTDRADWSSLENLIKAKAMGKDSAHPDEPNWRWLALYCVFRCRNDELGAVCEVAEDALKTLARQGLPEIETFQNIVGYCYLQFREWEKFYAIPQIPQDEKASQRLLSATYRQLLHGLAEIAQANFSRAQRYLEEAYQDSCRGLGSASLPSSLPGSLLAFIYYERLELNKAEHLLSEHLDVTSASGYFDIISRAYIAASRIAYLRKNTEGALKLLEQFEKVAFESGRARVQLVCAYEKMCFFLAKQEPAPARACLDQVMHLYQSAFKERGRMRREVQNYVGLAQGQHAMAEGRFAEAELLLDAVYRTATDTRDIYMLIVSGAALAISQCGNGKKQEALATFEKVLAPAEKAGMKASLMYQTSSIEPLIALYRKNALRDAKSWRHLGFAKSLLNTDNSDKKKASIKLTPREKEILQLIARAMSNKEISNVLDITPETVKGYLKNILIKFDVNKRAAAVSRATSMGLL